VDVEAAQRPVVSGSQHHQHQHRPQLVRRRGVRGGGVFSQRHRGPVQPHVHALGVVDSPGRTRHIGVMGVSAKELSRHLVTRAEQRLSRNRERTEHARQAAQVAAELLVGQFGARAVYLFGSLASGHAHELSDIDLAVEGVADESVPLARVRLEEMTSPIPIDVVPWEGLPESFRARILARGIRLA
jgi:predicted nucleotidyltransferase